MGSFFLVSRQQALPLRVPKSKTYLRVRKNKGKISRNQSVESKRNRSSRMANNQKQTLEEKLHTNGWL